MTWTIVDGSVEVDACRTVSWPDGFRVTRIAEHKGSFWVEISWQGRTRRLRLTKTKTIVQAKENPRAK